MAPACARAPLDHLGPRLRVGGHEPIQLDLATQVLFADPHPPWKRGTTENTNRLLRHRFEKDNDLRGWDDAGVRRVQDTLDAGHDPRSD